MFDCELSEGECAHIYLTVVQIGRLGVFESLPLSLGGRRS